MGGVTSGASEQRLVWDTGAPAADSGLTLSLRQKTEAVALVQAVVRDTSTVTDQTKPEFRERPIHSTRFQDSGYPPTSVHHIYGASLDVA